MTQELDLNPLLANIGFSAISTALNAGIQALMPNGQKDVFKFMFDTYMDNALTFLGYGDSPWLQASYMAQILDFSDIVRQKGLGEALNIYGSGFFNAVAVNQIVRTGYTLGGYFEHMLQTGQYRTETVNGQQVIAVDTPTQSDGGYSTGLFKWLVDASDWDPLGLGVTSGNGDVSWSLGEIGKDGYAKMGFYDDTTMYNEWGNLGIWQTIDNGNQTYAEIKDNAGKVIFVSTPREVGGYNHYNLLGEYVDADTTDFNGFKLSLVDGYTNYFSLGSSLNITNTDIALFLQYGITGNDIHAARFGFTRNLDGSYEDKLDLAVTQDSSGNYIVLGENIGKDPNAILGGNYWINTSFKEKYEVTKNFYKGYGVVTDIELARSAQNQYNTIISSAQEGDRIFFSGESGIDYAIKAAESAFGRGDGGIIMNHEGVVTIINNRKYVYEVIPGSLGDITNHALKCVPLEEALGRYVKVDSQGKITKVNGYFEAVRPDDVDASQKAVAWIKNKYFIGIEAKEAANPGKSMYATDPVSINFKELVGYYSPNDSDSMVCSELFNRAHYSVFRRLPDGVIRYHYNTLEVRISPQDDYLAKDEYGKLLSDIVAGN